MKPVFSFRYLVAYVCLTIATISSANAQDLSKTLPFDPNSIKGKFDNGLTYYVRSNHKPEKKVELRLVVKAGSILEDNSQLGLAHFMEHMNFNGTEHFPKNELVSYLQSIGVQFGADLNAYTSFDETVYILPIPTDKEGNLEKGFQVIEDWAHNALLTDKDIDEERAVVLEESRLGQGADMRMLKKYLPMLVQGSLYADRMPIGKDEILKTFKHEEIRRFYHDWYRPDLQAVMVVGDIDTATAMKFLRQHFAGLKNPPKEKERFYADVKPRTAADAMIVTDKEATNSLVQLIYPNVKKHDEITLGDYRKSICRNLALSILNKRLTDLAQGSEPPFPYAGVSNEGWIHGYTAFSATALFGNDGPDKAMNALTSELLRAKQYGFSNSELEIAKKEQMSFMEKSYNERKTTDSKDYIEEFIRGYLTGEPIPGIENEYSYYKDMVPGIQLSELNALVQDWMKDTHTFTLITAPANRDVMLPTNGTLLDLTTKALNQKVAAPEEKIIAKDLMTKKPTPGKVVSQKKEDGFDATTYTLSNGIKVTIKPTIFKSDEIILSGLKKGGINSYGVTDKQNVEQASDIVGAMGVGDFAPNDLRNVIAGKTIKVDVGIDEYKDVVSGSSSVKDFESMLQLLNLYITSPRKDAGLFDAFKEKKITELQFIMSNPQVSFFDTTIKTLYNNNPLARTFFPKPEDYKKINLDKSLEIYKHEIGCADGYHFFLVGNIDPATAIPLIETYIGSIPSANKAPDFKDNGVRLKTGITNLNVKKGKEKQSMIFAAYYGDVAYTEDISLKAQAVAEILNIKVIEDLREKMGGIYTGGFYAQVEKEPYEHYSIGMQLPCGPENVDTLLKASRMEITQLKSKGPDAKDLEKVKSQWREKHRTNLIENTYWASKLEYIIFWGRDKNNLLEYDKWIDKITPADVQTTANQLFNGKNEFVSVLYPEGPQAETERGSGK